VHIESDSLTEEVGVGIIAGSAMEEVGIMGAMYGIEVHWSEALVNLAVAAG